MLFGISFNELFIITVAVTVAGGYKKQFLQYSRSGGVFVGRAIGYVRKKRDQVLSSSTQQKELSAVQRQLGDALGQLNTLRYEVRSQSRILGDRSPDMMSSTEANSFNQSILQQEQRAVPPAAGMPNGPRAQDMPRTTPIGTGSLAGAPAHPNDAAADLHSPQATASGSHADPAQGVGLGFDAGNPLGVSTEGLYASEPSGVAPRGGANEFEGVSARQRFEQLKVHDDSGKVVIIGNVALIPVSAKAAGRVENRSGPLTGSDIAVDALAEQEVAAQAASVFSGGGP